MRFGTVALVLVCLFASGRLHAQRVSGPLSAPGAATGGLPAGTRLTLRAGTPADSPRRVNGRLDDPAWARADSVELTEIEPRQGAVPAERTVVRVMVTADVILVGIRCDDPDPTHLIAYARERDSDLSNEDHVRVVFDPFMNGRSGYVFAVNPNGARYDALITDQGQQRSSGRENPNWDTIWEAATARTATGWSVEIRIPVKSLLFKPGLTTWGFNVQRRVQRHLETQRWAGALRDFRITQTSRAGLLTDLPPLNLDRGLTIRPAVVSGASIDAPKASVRTNRDVSLDASQRLGSNTLASVTVNTDFAQTEVDQRRTNLTRFDLFYPEKRSFFLEGSDIFDFGPNLGQDIVPFFSRTIGLYDGRAVPISVGTKENGRIGATNFGLLAVRTQAVDSLVPAATMGAIRIKQNLFGESSGGLIATFGDPKGANNSWLAGGDLFLQTSHFAGDKNAMVGLWGLSTNRAGLTGGKSAGGVVISYPNDLWNNSFSYRFVGDGFQPSLGFVPRPGVQSFDLNMNFSPRPQSSALKPWLNQIFYEFRPSLVTDLNGKWESYRIFSAPINWRFQSGDRAEFNANPQGERLTEPFEIAPGDTIPAGSYHFVRYRLEAGLAAKRRVTGQFTWWFGSFYDGRLDQYVATMSVKPSSLFIVDLNVERDVGRVSHGAFTKDLFGVKFRINVSPDLQFNSLVQYDNSSHSLGSNTRIRWTFMPAGDLFVVYDHNLSTLETCGAFDSNSLQVKVQYAFRY
jgi:Domain of unknown function (DUF5916)